MRELSEIEPGAWIHLGDPSGTEIDAVSAELGIDAELLRAPLDEEESARIDGAGDWMILFRIMLRSLLSQQA